MSDFDDLAVVVEASDKNIARAASLLRQGKLVAFPTETVYGLGAVVSSDEALKSIFRAKGRPFSDPLIAHVSSLEMAASLWNLSGDALLVSQKLCSEFWPGPLTLVVPASSGVSAVVTSGGPTVGIRMPAHPIARALIAACGIPVAAPSANRFGHVSPTTARHVFDDLKNEDVLILDGGGCRVGIESTVARVLADGNVEVLRRGAITPEQIESASRKVVEKCEVTVLERFSRGGAAEAAPGQLLIHYAPVIPAYLLGSGLASGGRRVALERCALVDFGASLLGFSTKVAAYRDLSPSGDAGEASGRLFGVLRELELLEGLEAILLPDFPPSAGESLLALADRLRRAAALRRATLDASGAELEAG